MDAGVRHRAAVLAVSAGNDDRLLFQAGEKSLLRKYHRLFCCVEFISLFAIIKEINIYIWQKNH